MCEDVSVSELPVPPKHPWHIGRMLTAWAVAAVLGVLVTVLVTGEQRFHWLIFTIGLSTLVTFALQLGTAQREGFITRTSFSVAGSVVIIALIDVIGLLNS
jgi:DNA-binding HxlR family transcriptional regulator